MTAVLLEDGPDAGLVSHIDNPNLEQRRMEAGAGRLLLANREVLTVSGADRLSWLHSITSQFIEGLEPGRTVTDLVLSPTGHIEHVLHGVDDGQTFWAWTEPGRGQGLVDWLDSMRFMMRVEVALRPDLAVLWTGADVPTHKAPTPEGAGDAVRLDSEVAGGHELLVARSQAAELAAQLGTDAVGVRAWEALRIAAGVPRSPTRSACTAPIWRRAATAVRRRWPGCTPWAGRRGVSPCCPWTDRTPSCPLPAPR
jgi:folate-binding Fe-S cluster repair protein YgfZ